MPLRPRLSALALVVVGIIASSVLVATPAAAATVPVVLGDRVINRVYATYPSASGFQMSTATKKLHIVLPEEVLELGLDEIGFTLGTTNQNYFVNVGAPQAAFDIVLPSNFFSKYAPDWRGEYALNIYDPDENGKMRIPGNVHTLLEVSIGMSGSGSTVTLDLDRTNARSWDGTAGDTGFSVSSIYRPATAGDVKVKWGDTLTIQADPNFWTSGPEAWAQVQRSASISSADISSDSGYDATHPVGTVSADGSTVTVKLPAKSPADVDWGSGSRLSFAVMGVYPRSFNGEVYYGNLGYNSIELPLDFTPTTRIAGADRFAVGVALSKANFGPGVPVVFVSNGLNYPDALSAAPAAALLGGPLLLTTPTALPDTVKAEIQRLQPQRIVVVGGSKSVSTAVITTLKAIQPNTERWGGTDRYDASRTIVRNAFLAKGNEVGATTAYVATGANFPDALSASGAGGAFGTPVILVNGTAPKADAATIALLRDLGVTQIKVAGGPNSVSKAVLDSLRVIDATPTRLSGNDRFDASKNIAVDAFGALHPDTVFLATGFNFPDALSGAAIAGKFGAPLIVVQTDCIPAGTLQAITDFGATKITLLGGTASLTRNVANLKSC